VPTLSWLGDSAARTAKVARSPNGSAAARGRTSAEPPSAGSALFFASQVVT